MRALRLAIHQISGRLVYSLYGTPAHPQELLSIPLRVREREGPVAAATGRVRLGTTPPPHPPFRPPGAEVADGNDTGYNMGIPPTGADPDAATNNGITSAGGVQPTSIFGIMDVANFSSRRVAARFHALTCADRRFLAGITDVTIGDIYWRRVRRFAPAARASVDDDLAVGVLNTPCICRRSIKTTFSLPGLPYRVVIALIRRRRIAVLRRFRAW